MLGRSRHSARQLPSLAPCRPSGSSWSLVRLAVLRRGTLSLEHACRMAKECSKPPPEGWLGTVRVRRLGPGTFTVPVWTHSLSSLDSTLPFIFSPRRYRFSEHCGSFSTLWESEPLYSQKPERGRAVDMHCRRGPELLGALLWPFSEHGPPMGMGEGVYMQTGYTPPLAVF